MTDVVDSVATKFGIDEALTNAGINIEGLNAKQLKAVRGLVAQALVRQWTSETLARRIKPVVGLSSRYATAVDNYRQGLLNKGVLPGRADKMADDYAKRLQVSRARTVADFETAHAENQGKVDAWRMLQKAGKIGSRAVYIFKVHKDERLCPVCRKLNGRRFSLSSKAGIPPLHPNCRCTISLSDQTVVKISKSSLAMAEAQAIARRRARIPRGRPEGGEFAREAHPWETRFLDEHPDITKNVDPKDWVHYYIDNDGRFHPVEDHLSTAEDITGNHGDPMSMMDFMHKTGFARVGSIGTDYQRIPQLYVESGAPLNPKQIAALVKMRPEGWKVDVNLNDPPMQEFGTIGQNGTDADVRAMLLRVNKQLKEDAKLILKERVRTPAGVKRFGLPIGSPITHAVVQQLFDASPFVEKPEVKHERQRLANVTLSGNKVTNLLDEWDTDEDAKWEAWETAEGDWSTFMGCRQMRRAAAKLVGLSTGDVERGDPNVTSTGADWGGGWTVDEWQAETTAALYLDTLHNSSPERKPLWRGCRMTNEQLRQFKEQNKTGDVVDIPLASFSDSRKGTERFGTDLVFRVDGAKSFRFGDMGNPVYLTWSDIPPELRNKDYVESEHGFSPLGRENLPKDRHGNVRGFRPGDLISEEVDPDTYHDMLDSDEGPGEFISGGRLKIKSMRKRGDSLIVTLEQIGTFDPRTGEVAKAQGRVWVWDWLFDGSPLKKSPVSKAGPDMTPGRGAIPMLPIQQRRKRRRRLLAMRFGLFGRKKIEKLSQADKDNLYDIGRTHHASQGRWFPSTVEKAGKGNPFHDVLGRFTSGESAVSTAFHGTRFQRSDELAVGARLYAHTHGTDHDLEPEPDLGKVRALPANKRKAVADAFDAMPHDDPEAHAAYRALAKETKRQFRFLTQHLGVTVEVVDYDPYTSVQDMVRDVRENKHLKVLSTKSTGPHLFLSNDENDMFRAVHDAFGHAATGRAFDRDGEEAAYQAHRRMFSPLARKAMATETRGQNCYLITNGVFPDQKCALLPDELIEANPDMAKYRRKLKVEKTRHVRTPEGARRFKLPIGSLIVPPVNLFHATPAKNLDSIMENGIQAHAASYGQTPGVYGFENPAHAYSYGGKGKVIVEFKPTRVQRVSNGYRVAETVPPENIVRVTDFSGKDITPKRRHVEPKLKVRERTTPVHELETNTHFNDYSDTVQKKMLATLATKESHKSKKTGATITLNLNTTPKQVRERYRSWLLKAIEDPDFAEMADWYLNEHNDIADETADTGIEPWRVCHAIAAMSQANYWPSNKQEGIDLAHFIKDHGKEFEGKSDEDVRAAWFAWHKKKNRGVGYSVPAGYMPFINAVHIMRGGNGDDVMAVDKHGKERRALNQPKVRSFANNLANPLGTDAEDVTVDTKMFEAAIDHPTNEDETLKMNGVPGVNGYSIGCRPVLADVCRELATDPEIVRAIGGELQPLQVQALIWMEWLETHNKADKRMYLRSAKGRRRAPKPKRRK